MGSSRQEMSTWRPIRYRVWIAIALSFGWALTAATLVQAQLATPVVCLTQTSICNCATTPEDIEVGSTTFTLWLDPGPMSSSVSGDVCTFEGVGADGDEICGLAIGLESTSLEIALDLFEVNAALDPAVVFKHVSVSNIILNHFNPDSDDACVELGTLTVSRSDVPITGDAFVQLTATTSEWVDAGLGVQTFPTTYLPEPSPSIALAIGGLFAFALGIRARRGQHRRARRGSAAAAATIAVAIAGEAHAFEYFELDAFLARVGPAARHIDFESYPLDDNGYNVFASSSELRRGATISAEFVPSPIPLSGPPVALIGTFLVFDPQVAEFGVVASPGSTNVDHDDVRITFGDPVRAAGVRVIDATNNDGMDLTDQDEIRFLDAYGGVLAQYLLDGVKQGRSAFVGYVARPGSLPVAEIRIIESVGGGPLSDDIWIDDVVYLSTKDPYADEWVRFVPNQAGFMTELPEWDAARALDEEDSLHVSLGPSGQVAVQFTDNALVADGSASPDLRIWGAASGMSMTTVEISEDTTTWIAAGTATGQVTNLDIDPLPLVTPGTRYSFVRLTDLAPPGTSQIDAIEALSSVAIADQDFDGIADAVDNCVSTPNPTQADDDDDGVGNRCDNCRVIANPSQTDDDSDGEGNACERPTLKLLQDPPPSRQGLQRTGADLYIDCGAFDIHQLNVGVVKPPASSQLTFGAPEGADGPGCAAPYETNVLSPISGAGCLGRTGVGSTVDRSLSGVAAPGSSAPAPYREDAMFLFLYGGPADTDLLCSAGERDIFLGRINFMAPTSANYLSLLGLTARGAILGVINSLGGSGGGSPQPMFMSFTSESVPPGLYLEITPSAGEEAASAVSWDVCITDESILLMHRISFGLLGPPESDGAEDISLEGCTTGPDSSGFWECEEDGVHFNVDAENSWAYGPFAEGADELADIPELQAGALYVLLQGWDDDDGELSYGLLNFGNTAPTCIATINIDEAYAGTEPEVVYTGVEDLTAPDEPFVDENGDGVNGAMQVGWSTSIDTGYDADGDGELDDSDNCEIVSNADQANSGGFQNDIDNDDLDGDACECGDGNDTGEVWETGMEATADVDSIRNYLAQVSSDATTRMKCSAIGTTTCNMADVSAWHQALTDDSAIGDGACEAVSGAPPE
ncbi:MAG: hypothetical protein GY910_11535 [bacterium]|nr:hypothetical protein [bacterium]